MASHSYEFGESYLEWLAELDNATERLNDGANELYEKAQKLTPIVNHLAQVAPEELREDIEALQTLNIENIARRVLRSFNQVDHLFTEPEFRPDITGDMNDV